MFRIDRKISVMLSYIFCALSFFGVLLLAIALPFFRSANVPFLANQDRFGFWGYFLEYVILALVLISTVCLVLLLNNVRSGAIFTSASVGYLRVISWASILAGVLAIPLCFLIEWNLLLPVAFVGLFLGVVLRVVKNVIEEGTAIKEENDSTI
ncbi:MAG: DUF2975 domain-containing protein [Clostridia bacterium]|nr:DUF2975 domain-containing protein [Clostridia bacterium]